MITTTDTKQPVNYLRHADLVQRRIVNNRTTLSRLIRNGWFPAAVRLGDNIIAWRSGEVMALGKSACRRAGGAGMNTLHATDIRGFQRPRIERLEEHVGFLLEEHHVQRSQVRQTRTHLYRTTCLLKILFFMKLGR